MKPGKATCVLFLLLLAATLNASVGNSEDSVFINRGFLLSVDSLPLHITSLNRESVFSATPYIAKCKTGDTLFLYFTNNDSINHELLLKNHDANPFIVPVGTTILKTIVLDKNGVFSIISVSEEVNFSGLCGLVIVDSIATHVHPFYWVLKEYQTAWLNAYPNLSISDSISYRPEYFTINNHSFPDVQADILARIEAGVGDNIRLYIYNAGLMNHNIHFHGYHVAIAGSSQSPGSNGRKKDSFPIDRDEFLILDFSPDQPGKFPVHNHNLGATLGNNIYPNGMVVFIEISE